MDTLECIKTRRSVRKYTDQPINERIIHNIIEAAISAPSGKNRQPWKFKIISDKNLICSIANLSIYSSWMKTAPLFVAVFLDNTCSYDHMKDIQSCGAVMQNMMLAAHTLDIGSCWIGGILAKAKEVKQILYVDNVDLELMGIVVFGHKTGRTINPGRKKTELFLL